MLVVEVMVDVVEHGVRLVDSVVREVELRLVVAVGLTALPGPAPPSLLADVEVVEELDEEAAELEVVIELVTEDELLLVFELDEATSAQLPPIAVMWLVSIVTLPPIATMFP